MLEKGGLAYLNKIHWLGWNLLYNTVMVRNGCLKKLLMARWLVAWNVLSGSGGQDFQLVHSTSVLELKKLLFLIFRAGGGGGGGGGVLYFGVGWCSHQVCKFFCPPPPCLLLLLILLMVMSFWPVMFRPSSLVFLLSSSSFTFFPPLSVFFFLLFFSHLDCLHYPPPLKFLLCKTETIYACTL